MTETGRVRLLRYIAVHDVGRPMNLTVVENQIEGGTIQGLALAQAEEMRFDPRDGRCLNASSSISKLPTALDFDPRVIEAVVVPNKGELGPYGAKGLGENPPPGHGCDRQCDLTTRPASVRGGAVHPFRDFDGAERAEAGGEPHGLGGLRPDPTYGAGMQYPRRSEAKNFSYSRPATLREAREQLGKEHGKVALLAGGTASWAR